MAAVIKALKTLRALASKALMVLECIRCKAGPARVPAGPAGARRPPTHEEAYGDLGQCKNAAMSIACSELNSAIRGPLA